MTIYVIKQYQDECSIVGWPIACFKNKEGAIKRAKELNKEYGHISRPYPVDNKYITTDNLPSRDPFALEQELETGGNHFYTVVSFELQ